MPEVSEVRLNQTLLAEYPQYRKEIDALRNQKTEHSLASLADLWAMKLDKAQIVAEELKAIGLFDRRNRGGETSYWVPFLYRPALEMVQGSAD